MGRAGGVDVGHASLPALDRPPAVAMSGEGLRQDARSSFATGDMQAAVRLFRRGLTIDAVPGPDYKPFRKALMRVGQPDAAVKVARWMFVTSGRPPPATSTPVAPQAATPPHVQVAAAAAAPRLPTTAGRAVTAEEAASGGTAGILLTNAGLALLLAVTLAAASAVAASRVLILDGLAGAAAMLLAPLVLAAGIEILLRAVFLVRSGFAGWAEGMLAGVEVHIDDLDAVAGRQGAGAAFSKGRYMMHPHCGYVRPPGMRGINRQGTRGPDYPDRGPSATYRILLLGGSVAERFASAGPRGGSHYLAHHLRAAAEAAGYSGVELCCGAVSGWNSIAFTQHALIHGDRFDCIVALFGINEYSHGARKTGGQYAMGAKTFYAHFVDIHRSDRDREAVALGLLIRQLTAQVGRLSRIGGVGTAIGVFALARMLRRLQARFRAVATAEQGPGNEPFRILLDDLFRSDGGFERSLDETRRGLATLTDFCGREGVTLHGFLQPSAVTGKRLSTVEQTRVGEQLAAYARYPEFCDALLAKAPAGLALQDLREVFAGEEATLYHDICHFAEDEDGRSPGMDRLAHRMAECLAPRIRRRMPA